MAGSAGGPRRIAVAAVHLSGRKPPSPPQSPSGYTTPTFTASREPSLPLEPKPSRLLPSSPVCPSSGPRLEKTLPRYCRRPTSTSPWEEVRSRSYRLLGALSTVVVKAEGRFPHPLHSEGLMVVWLGWSACRGSSAAAELWFLHAFASNLLS